jgi:hypothetical protein
MSERDVDPAVSADLPTTTGEFRARPDISANTSEFRAFADGRDSEAEPPWAMRAPGRNVARLTAIVIGVAVVLVIIAILVLKL